MMAVGRYPPRIKILTTKCGLIEKLLDKLSLPNNLLTKAFPSNILLRAALQMASSDEIPSRSECTLSDNSIESNEAICCEYISAILHVCIQITRKLRKIYTR